MLSDSKTILTSEGLKVILVCILCSLFCQIIKFIHLSIKFKKPFFKAFSIAGGFPSSHSAVVTSLDICIFAVQYKTNNGLDFLFSVAIIFTIIVIYDAMSVRYESGKHAAVLNKLVKNLSEEDRKSLELDNVFPLTESLGHRLSEVVAGILIGVIFGLIAFAIM